MIYLSAKQFRNFATILYTDSMPDNVFDLISDLHVPCALSPLHDMDIKDDGTGELKKPHYHLLFCLDAKTTEHAAREMIASIGGVGLEIVKSKRSYARYLCHLDNSEKAQYDKSGIKLFGGIILDLDGVERNFDLVKELYEIVSEFNCATPRELARSLIYLKRFDLLDFCCKNAYFVRTFVVG